MPPSSAQYTVSVATDAVAYIFIPPKMLVDRRDLGGVAGLQGAEVADPRGAGGQSGQHQEEPGVWGERERVAPLAGGVHEPGQHDDDDRRANESRQVGVDPFEPKLGEDG